METGANNPFHDPRTRILGFDDPETELRYWLSVIQRDDSPIPSDAIDKIVELDGVLELVKLLRLEDERARRRASAALWLLWHRAEGVKAEQRLEYAERLLETGDFQDCVKSIDKILDEFPDFAEAFNKRATAHFLAGNFDRAVRDCEETIARNPIHFGAWHGLGLCLLKLHRVREALAAFGKAHAIQPHEPGNRRGLELCERELASGNWTA